MQKKKILTGKLPATKKPELTAAPAKNEGSVTKKATWIKASFDNPI